jgi:hypothetical protein
MLLASATWTTTSAIPPTQCWLAILPSLDERVLNGLKETYNSLGVPIGATVQAIQAIKEVTASLVGLMLVRKWVFTSTTSPLA